VVAGGVVDVEVVVVGEVLVELVVGVVGVVVVVDDVLEVEELVVEVVAACGRHCWLASWPTVETPWSRSWRSVGLTVAGNSATARLRLTVAFDTPVQSPDWSDEEIWLSCVLIELD
jgi:hypothetical protein